MIKRLQRDGGDVGLQWVEAVILEEADIDEQALLEMEQHEQLTENFKVRYNDIDYLLALRDAALSRDVDWFDRQSIEDVAGELQTTVEKSRGEVVRDLFAIKYMDLFLEDSHQAGRYNRLLGTLERFRDIGRMMLRVEQESPLEVDGVLQVLFAAIRSGVPYDDIRSIRAMFREGRGRFDQLASEIEKIEEENGGLGDAALSSPVTTQLRDSEDDYEPERNDPGPEVPNYPRPRVSTAIKVAIDAFDASRQTDVLRTLREARNRLDLLSEDERLRAAILQGAVEGLDLISELSAVVEWSDAHRDLLQQPQIRETT